MRKIFLSALLALCMVLTILPADALAGYYGDTLDTDSDEKAIYDALESNIADIQSGQAVQYTVTVPAAQADARVKELGKAALSAAYAFKTDHPEIFWLGPKVEGSVEGLVIGGNAALTVSAAIPFGAGWAKGGKRAVSTDQTAVNAAITTIVTEARKQASVYDSLKYAHDWLTSNNAYNKKAAAANFSNINAAPWSAASALLSDLSPVCEGYSKAFKLICDELDVPCVLVSGKGDRGDHMWNYVQLDNSWYAVDVTWDDPVVNGKDTKGRDTYFLVGSGTVDSDGDAFKTSHVPDSKLKYPTLSADRYDNSRTAKQN